MAEFAKVAEKCFLIRIFPFNQNHFEYLYFYKEIRFELLPTCQVKMLLMNRSLV
jgi:hypothetical protein